MNLKRKEYFSFEIMKEILIVLGKGNA